LNPENQKKILDTASRVFNDVANALGKVSFSYEDGIRFIRDHGNKTLFELLLEIVTRAMPVVGQKQDLTPEVIPALLDEINTRERAEALLARYPDPAPAELDRYIREVLLFLPSIRKVLIPFAKQLPPAPGGHPRKIPKQDEPRVRAEIAQLFDDGWPFPAAKKEVARRKHTSLSTIQRICRRGNIKLDGSDTAERIKIKGASLPPVGSDDKP
jgi:hypothetical protein